MYENIKAEDIQKSIDFWTNEEKAAKERKDKVAIKRAVKNRTGWEQILYEKTYLNSLQKEKL